MYASGNHRRILQLNLIFIKQAFHCRLSKKQPGDAGFSLFDRTAEIDIPSAQCNYEFVAQYVQ